MSMQMAQIPGAVPAGVGPVLAMSPWDVLAYSYGYEVITIQVATDGSISVSGGTQVRSAGSTAWYLPITGAIGNSYWVKLTQTSVVNVGINGGSAIGSWLALTANRAWTIDIDVSALRDAYFNIEIASDSGGVTVVGRMMGCQFHTYLVTSGGA